MIPIFTDTNVFHYDPKSQLFASWNILASSFRRSVQRPPQSWQGPLQGLSGLCTDWLLRQRGASSHRIPLANSEDCINQEHRHQTSPNVRLKVQTMKVKVGIKVLVFHSFPTIAIIGSCVDSQTRSLQKLCQAKEEAMDHLFDVPFEPFKHLIHRYSNYAIVYFNYIRNISQPQSLREFIIVKCTSVMEGCQFQNHFDSRCRFLE